MVDPKRRLQPTGPPRRDRTPEVELLLAQIHQEGVLRYPAGQLLQVKEETQTQLLLMVAGLAKVRSLAANGSEEVLHLLGPGDCLGIACLLEAEHPWRDVVGLTATAVVRLNRETAQALLQQAPVLALSCIAQLHDQLNAVAQQVLQRRLPAGDRVLAALADLAGKAAPRGDGMAGAPLLSLAELSAITGLARETVSRCLQQLQANGHLSKERDGWTLPLASAVLQPATNGSSTDAFRQAVAHLS